MSVLAGLMILAGCLLLGLAALVAAAPVLVGNLILDPSSPLLGSTLFLHYLAQSSAVALLLASLVPLTLGVGLWQVQPWAWAMSVALLMALLVPALASSIGVFQDSPSMDAWATSTVSILGLLILCRGSVRRAFREGRGAT